jgi:hypothetical protein
MLIGQDLYISARRKKLPSSGHVHNETTEPLTRLFLNNFDEGLGEVIFNLFLSHEVALLQLDGGSHQISVSVQCIELFQR